MMGFVRVGPPDNLKVGTVVVSRLLGFLFDLDFLNLWSGFPRGGFLSRLLTPGLCVEWFGSVFFRATPGQLSSLCALEA